MAHNEDFEKFFKQRFPALVSYLVKLGFSGSEAQESAEDAMVRVLERWDAITHHSAYAYRTALNHCVRERERWLRGRAPSLERVDAVDQFALKDAEIDFLKALSELPLRQREVLALDWADFDTATIAEILGLPPSTVRSHRRHARNALRQRPEANTSDARKRSESQ